MSVHTSKDFWAGVMFLGFAGIAVITAGGYSVGTAGRMGPGYFPLALGMLLGVLGFITIGRAIVDGSDRVAPLQWRPLLVLPAAVCLFGLLIQWCGLAITVVIVVVASACAARESRPLEVAALATTLAVFCTGIFVYALRLPLPLWPAF